MLIHYLNNKIFCNFPIKLTEGHPAFFKARDYIGNHQEAEFFRAGVGYPGVQVIKEILSTPGVKSIKIKPYSSLEIETEYNMEIIAETIKALAMTF